MKEEIDSIYQLLGSLSQTVGGLGTKSEFDHMDRILNLGRLQATTDILEKFKDSPTYKDYLANEEIQKKLKDVL